MISKSRKQIIMISAIMIIIKTTTVEITNVSIKEKRLAIVLLDNTKIRVICNSFRQNYCI